MTALPPRLLNLVVLTQDDRFYIPRNVDLLCRSPEFHVREIIILDSAGAVRNRGRDLLRWFGAAACLRMGVRAGASMLLAGLDRLTGSRLPGTPRSLRSIAHRHGVPFSIVRDANAPGLLDRLDGYDLDVVVSFSAPQVFRERLLRLPRLGAVNLHCSLLPQYRGLLPSFWVLYHGEEVSGATVHFMDADIDNGDILRQVTVDIRGMRSMHEVLIATKRAGGDIMLEALHELAAGTLVPKPNPVAEGTYFSWPTTEQARDFRRRGNRLV